MQGLVVDTSQLQKEPHVVATARGKGLQLLTYGLGNNDPSWVQQQGRIGVAAAIVDDVDNIAPLATAKLILAGSGMLSSRVSKPVAEAQNSCISEIADKVPGTHFHVAPIRTALRLNT